ncbi:hypothetical protein [Sinorhizobium meliloti]|nr:hypothetical protein [Sinorhizobium meliloti]
MNELTWEALQIAMWGALAFAAICALSAYGCYRLGPEEGDD